MSSEQYTSHKHPRIGGRGSVTFDEDSLLHDSQNNKINNNASNHQSSSSSSTLKSSTVGGGEGTTTNYQPENNNLSNKQQHTGIYSNDPDLKHIHSNSTVNTVPSPPRNPRMTRAMRSLAMHGGDLLSSSSSSLSSLSNPFPDGNNSASYYSSNNIYDGTNHSSYATNDYPKPRATSGSEIGLELDPQTTKVIEVYGFVGWISTFLAYIGYLLWAYLPESLLHEIGVSYYPNKYWALAAPAMLLLSVISYSTIYGSIGFFVNPHLNSYETLDDHYSKPFTLLSARSASINRTNSNSVRERKGSGSKSPHKLRSRAGTTGTINNNNLQTTGTTTTGAGATVHDSHTCTDCGSVVGYKQHNYHSNSYTLPKDSSPSPIHSGSTPSIQSPLRGPGVRAAHGVAPVASVIPAYNTSPNVSRANSNLYPTLRSGYPILELNIDQTMPTPDIADVPVTLINRLQFGFRQQKYQKFRIVKE